MQDIYDPKFVKAVFDRCSDRYIAFSLICSLGFTERWSALRRHRRLPRYLSGSASAC